MLYRVFRIFDMHLFPVQKYSSGLAWEHTVDSGAHLGSSRSHQSAQSKHLACAHLEGYLVYQLSVGDIGMSDRQPLYPENLLPDRILPCGIQLGKLPSYHVRDDFSRIVILLLKRADIFSVSEDGHPIRQLHDFFQFMCNKNNACSLLL